MKDSVSGGTRTSVMHMVPMDALPRVLSELEEQEQQGRKEAEDSLLTAARLLAATGVPHPSTAFEWLIDVLRQHGKAFLDTSPLHTHEWVK